MQKSIMFNIIIISKFIRELGGNRRNQGQQIKGAGLISSKEWFYHSKRDFTQTRHTSVDSFKDLEGFGTERICKMRKPSEKERQTLYVDEKGIVASRTNRFIEQG